ncbi:YheT family hydrolase [Dichelobacter nodosus]|uniref:YheT family hydrolase n=1 Tax=Dichelobacter nodosus TaxID=870 RepID=UPI000E292653|nr:alpha/beta fold hydrolase [Dichelobacter nodosus]AXM45054.1 alpha/beta fold hydrolase [Dichelobacter nodosus]
MNFTPAPLLAPFWLNNAHADTIITRFFPKIRPPYRREWHRDSSDQTNIAYDFLDSNRAEALLLVLFHGLEGSSLSHYAARITSAAHKIGWHAVVPHFRGCGGVENTARCIYHSGDSQEIAFVLNQLQQKYPKIVAVGVSLGGNALAKYLGETGQAARVEAAVIISAPINLPAAGKAMAEGINARLYSPYFLRSLLPKVRRMKALYPDLPIPAAAQPKTLRDFDDLYTAPLAGFANAEDYYQRASGLPYLRRIMRPTLLLNAQNDPFLPAQFLPTAQDVSSFVQLCQPKRGGHVGFVSGKFILKINWLEQTTLDFLRAAMAAFPDKHRAS